MRLRCPHCQQQFELGIAAAEVVTEPTSVAVILPDNFEQMQEAAQPAPASQPPAAETSGSDLTSGEKKGCLVMTLLLLVAAIAGTWLFSSKKAVAIVEPAGQGLQTRDNWAEHFWFYVSEDRLFGAPAAFGRLVGLQPPSEIMGEGGKVSIAALAASTHEANDLIVVNQTKGDIYYTAMTYGDQDKVDKNAEIGPIKIAPGAAAAALNKTHTGPHGGYNMGCAEAPDESESFQVSEGETFDYAVLGWFTTEPPEDCVAAKEKEFGQ